MSAGPRRIANVGSLSAVNPTIDSYIEKKRAMEERARQIKEERANMKPGLGLPKCIHELASPPITPTAYQTRGAFIILASQSSIKPLRRDRRSWRDTAIPRPLKITSLARHPRHPSRTHPRSRIHRPITDTLPQGSEDLSWLSVLFKEFLSFKWCSIMF
jgi:hypothetical protein